MTLRKHYPLAFPGERNQFDFVFVGPLVQDFRETACREHASPRLSPPRTDRDSFLSIGSDSVDHPPLATVHMKKSVQDLYANGADKLDQRQLLQRVRSPQEGAAHMLDIGNFALPQ